MNISELAKMKEDRLANSAVTAFLGSLLMGQSWQMWEGSQATTKLLMFTVPDYFIGLRSRRYQVLSCQGVSS